MKIKNRKKVFVGMSGGVDSSVAAFLLKKQGYDVIGIFMKCFNIDGCAERDAEDARRVAEKLEIPFYVWDFEKEYKKKVVEYMIKGYKKGITPNPDVMCNREIKFGLFLDKALKMGADYVATGHYVCLRRNFEFRISNFEFDSKFKIKNLKFSLLQAKDQNKDQSYFLWTLTQEQLKHCLFPINDYLKSEVRQIARKAGLPTAEKKDSQGICFLGQVNLSDFLKKYIPEKKGDILLIKNNATNNTAKNIMDNIVDNMDNINIKDVYISCDRTKCRQVKNKNENKNKDENKILYKKTYKKIGEHKGAHFYTIGQRHGLGVGGSEKPYYVVEKNIKKNIIIVAEGDDNPALCQKEIKLINVNLINPTTKLLNYPITIYARVRYRQPLAKAELRIKNKELRIIFKEPQKFVAPGQSAVFYNKKGEMLGGGVIF